MDYPPKRNGDQHAVRTSRNELHRVCPNMKLQDKLKPDKTSLSYADFHHEITKNAKHVPHKLAGDHQKHRIAGKEVDEDELVKYMSKLPSFLQKGEPVKEKALNVGVLDWGLLEKWQYKHKQVPSRSSGYSPSSSNTSSSFSTDGSSTHSSRGHSCSPTRQRTRRPSFQSHLTAPLLEDSRGTSAKTFQDLETTQSNASLRPRNSTTAALAVNKMHPDVLRKEKEEHKKQASELKRKSRALQSDQNFGVSQAAEKMDAQAGHVTKREENSQKPDVEHAQHNDPEGKTIVLLLPKDLPESKNHVEPQDSNSAAMPDQKTKVCHKSLSEGCKKALQEGCSSDIPHSCPHPSGVRREEYRVKQYNTRDSAAVSIDCASRSSKPVLQPPNIRPNPSRERILEDKTSTALPTCSTLLKQSKAPEQKPKKVMTEKVRSISPFDRFMSGASNSRLPSSKDGLDKCNPRPVDVSAKSGTGNSQSSIGNSVDKHRGTGKARSSPLRRLLQPLLKPKAENNHQVAEPLERVSVSTDKACKSGEAEHVSVATWSAKVKLGMTGCKKISVNEFAMGKKHGPSTMQALFRVAVKNGLPIYTFAINNESSILAATVKKLNAEKTGGFSCVYTFFTIQDMKKKKNNGSWINQGGKRKSHDYISNVVAQMKASDSGLIHSSTKFGVREFVLFSVDLRHAEDQTSEFHPNNELAAIIVKLPKKTNASTVPTGNTSRACQSGSVSETTVILPSAVHSLPSKGGPSSLIERWVNGGSCDCGGWDLGCKLRVLANPNQSHKKSSLELFPQGVQENQQVFSLSPFKEGTYSVEFHSSLSVLQAFSICTAVLDSRKKCEPVEPSNSVEEKNLGEPILVQNAGTSVPTKAEAEGSRYLSYPPHSPVGRV